MEKGNFNKYEQSEEVTSDEEDLRALAAQLRCPDGEKGIDIAHGMYETNTAMFTTSLPYLDIQPDQEVLELGYGNGRHVTNILDIAPSIKYKGLDISETMRDEAHKNAQTYFGNADVQFDVYGGTIIPYFDRSIDRIITVNTIYFWEYPEQLLEELHRVLANNGKAIITYVAKETLLSLPFTQYNFRMYSEIDIHELILGSSFSGYEMIYEKDHVVNKMNEKMERAYRILVLRK